MFQKLYRHLEEINSSLRKEKVDNTNELLADKIAEKLDTVNLTILSQNKLLQSQQEQATEKPASSGYLPAANRLIAIAGIIAIIVLSYNAFSLARAASTLTNARIQPQVTYQAPQQSPEVIAGATAVQQHLAKLDSLIAEQTQALKELKKLNAVAVANFSNLKKHFAHTDTVAKAQPQSTDSLSAAR
jgi:hypothetical protein